ncbi:MAG: glycoside hydrolase family 97 catalytic domain-containing protein [Pseudomonadota bacterium]
MRSLLFCTLGLISNLFLITGCAERADGNAERPAGQSGGLAQKDGRANEWSISSPDGRLTVTVRRWGGDNGPDASHNDVANTAFQDAVAFEDDAVLTWSNLGIVTAVADTRRPDLMVRSDFRETVRLEAVERGVANHDYQMIVGKRRANKATAKTLTLSLVDEETSARLAIDVQVFNDGFGVRYRRPETDILFHWLEEDATSFALAAAGTHWGQPYDVAGVYTPAYETSFTRGIPIDTRTNLTVREAPAETGAQGTGWGFPSLFETTSGLWLLIHETDLMADDQGSHLAPDAPGGHYRLAPPLADSAMGLGRATAAMQLPWASPWRIGIVGRTPGALVESSLVFHLSTPSQIDDTDWIEPGVSAWSWPSDHTSSRSLPKLKNSIDLAAQMGWPYALVDANWNTISDDSMEQLVAHADAHGVGLSFWYNSGGRHNFVTEQPRNIMDDPRRRRQEMQRLQMLGVKAIKVDFFHSDKQDMMQLYLDILRDAADHKIMVIFHGSTIPRGWARTWPNLMTMESVLGAEAYTFGGVRDYGALAPYQNTVLVFTRNVIGSMDYTPVTYKQQMIPRRTTLSHETALSVLFESGLQHIADAPESLRQLPRAYKDFFRTLPTAWDETRYVTGYPGKDAVLARRRGARWYVVGINGEDTAKSLALDLSFLGEAQQTALIYSDTTDDGQTDATRADSTGAFGVGQIIIQPATPTMVAIEPFGGFVMVLDAPV